MKRMIVLSCVVMLSGVSFASAADNSHGVKTSHATDFSARKKMKRMKKHSTMPSGMSNSGMDKNKPTAANPSSQGNAGPGTTPTK